MKGLNRFDLYELVRDATAVGGAQRLLLDALAWRANPRESYSCFPSYQRLSADTHCTEQALRIAARSLETAGFIKREKRRNRSNVFYLNVPVLLDMKEAKRTAKLDASKGEPVVKRDDPFNTSRLAERDDLRHIDNTDGLDVDPADEAAPETDSMERLLRMVKIIWPDHPSLANEHLLMRDLEECVRTVGGIQRCSDLFFYLQATDDEARHQVAESRMLGRYLAKMVSIWLPTYAHKLAPPTNTNEDEHEPER